jgi:outer membrane protein assembly factor BamD
MKKTLCLFLAAFCVLSQGCAMFKGKGGKAESESAEEAAAAVSSSDELFERGMDSLRKKKYKKAVEAFKDLDTTYPYSAIASRGQLLSAYASYNAGEYDDAVSTLERFIKMHPAHENVDYAYYLKAVSYYDRISDVGRDQGVTVAAKQSLLDVIRRFPESEYSRDAKLKLDLVDDHLAGKEVEIGRFYQKRLKPTAAINRFQNVTERYQTTSHVQEALYRLTETYLSIGVADEAKKYAAILGYNYPHSKWYAYAYRLLEDTAGLSKPGKGSPEETAQEREERLRKAAAKPAGEPGFYKKLWRFSGD